MNSAPETESENVMETNLRLITDQALSANAHTLSVAPTSAIPASPAVPNFLPPSPPALVSSAPPVPNPLAVAKSGPISAPVPGQEVFIKKREVARRLQTQVRTVDNWMKRGLLPYYKIGRSVSFKWSEVEEQLRDTCRVRRG